MTKHISETLGLPLLEDALRDAGVLPEATPEEPVENAPAMTLAAKLDEADAAAKRFASASGEDHERSMDSLNREALDNARQLFDLAMNMDHARARGMFEQSANFYKIALDAKNSKRDRQLKTLQLAIEQRRIELAEKKTKAELGEQDSSSKDVIVVEDRNELIRRMRAQLKGDK